MCGLYTYRGQCVLGCYDNMVLPLYKFPAYASLSVDGLWTHQAVLDYGDDQAVLRSDNNSKSTQKA